MGDLIDRRGGGQSGSGHSDLMEVLSTSGVAPRGRHCLGFGDGVLDADPLGGLLVALLSGISR